MDGLTTVLGMIWLWDLEIDIQRARRVICAGVWLSVSTYSNRDKMNEIKASI